MSSGTGGGTAHRLVAVSVYEADVTTAALTLLQTFTEINLLVNPSNVGTYNLPASAYKQLDYSSVVPHRGLDSDGQDHYLYFTAQYQRQADNSFYTDPFVPTTPGNALPSSNACFRQTIGTAPNQLLTLAITPAATGLITPFGLPGG